MWRVIQTALARADIPGGIGPVSSGSVAGPVTSPVADGYSGLKKPSAFSTEMVSGLRSVVSATGYTPWLSWTMKSALGASSIRDQTGCAKAMAKAGITAAIYAIASGSRLTTSHMSAIPNGPHGSADRANWSRNETLVLSAPQLLPRFGVDADQKLVDSRAIRVVLKRTGSRRKVATRGCRFWHRVLAIGLLANSWAFLRSRLPNRFMKSGFTNRRIWTVGFPFAASLVYFRRL